MPRDREALLDIVESAKIIRTFVAGKSREQFLADVQCQDAVIRRLEIIGEAAKKLSDAARDALPLVPWRDIIGMRNLLIHDYDDVDLVIVWDTTQKNIPLLLDAISVEEAREKG